MSTKLERILFVEDDPDIREIASIALSEIHNFNVTMCESGKEAIENVKVEIPQLILMDVMMPEIDGITAAKSIREDFPEIPIVFLTAKVQTHEVEEYEKKLNSFVIHKPFDPTKLGDRIIEIWGKIQ